MCLLEAEGFYPCGQVGFAGIGIEHLAMQQFCTGAARSKLFIGLAHVAAARCGKGNDCFTLQIIAFQKCIRFLYKGIIIKHNKTEPTYTKTSLFLCEKRRFFMARTEKGVVTTI